MPDTDDQPDETTTQTIASTPDPSASTGDVTTPSSQTSDAGTGSDQTPGSTPADTTDSSASPTNGSTSAPTDSSADTTDSSADKTDSSSAAATTSSGDNTGDSSTGSQSTSSDDSSTTPVSSDSTDSQALSSSPDADTPANELTVDPITPVSLDPGDPPTQTAIGQNPDQQEAASGLPGVGDVIAVGTAIADIMKDSAPDYTMRGAPVSVVPSTAQPLDLVNFSADPHEMKMEIVVKSRFGFTRADLPIVVQWHYNGQYKAHGRYINNASIFIDSGAAIGAFYKVNINAALQGPANAGTTDDPVATVAVHIEINISDKISPYFKMIVLEGKISGDGSGSLAERT